MNPVTMVDSLGRAAIEGAVLMLGVWALCRIRPGLPAWARGGLWWLASARLLVALLPLAPLQIPSPLPVTTVWWPGAIASPAAPAEDLADSPTVASASTPSVGPVGQPVTTADPSAAAPAHRTGLDPTTVALALCVLWGLGVAVRVVGLGRQFWRVRRARRSARPVSEDEAGALGVPERVRLAISSVAPVPMVTGLVRPTVLIPAGLTSRPRAEIRLAVAHEVAHVRRGDLWFAWVPAMAETLFWFHPLVPIAVREYVQACEEACDEEALRSTGAAPYDYGRLLLALGVHRRFSGATAMPCGSPSPRQLTRRLSMLEFFDPFKPRVRLAAVGLVCAVALVGLAPLRVVPISAAPSSAQPETSEGDAFSSDLAPSVEAPVAFAPEGGEATATAEAPEPSRLSARAMEEDEDEADEDVDDAEEAEDLEDAEDRDDDPEASEEWEWDDTPPAPAQPARPARPARTPRPGPRRSP